MACRVRATAEDVLDKPKCRPGSKRNFTHCKDQLTYVHTNEGYLHVFRPYIEPLGGAYIGIGAGEGANDPPVHNPYYDFNDNILPLGAAYWMELVRQQLPL